MNHHKNIWTFLMMRMRGERDAPSEVGTSSTPEIVEPSSYERRMNAKNAARSRIPQPEQTPPHFSRGRGWIRPGTVIQNVHSVPPGGPQFVRTPHTVRPGYAMPLRPPAWPTQGAMPMFPSAVPPIPPPYQFGLGTGPFFPVPPPAMGHHPLAPHLFSSPPPSRPPHPHYPYHQHQPPY
ncbi:hypothetical protein B566_EDAN004009 [Ephemera danica]|nr:hypothetical protein B566_EDAN004009 [Ephemera danica]